MEDFTKLSLVGQDLAFRTARHLIETCAVEEMAVQAVHYLGYLGASRVFSCLTLLEMFFGLHVRESNILAQPKTVLYLNTGKSISTVSVLTRERDR